MQATGQQPDANNAEALINAGYQQREPWLKKVDIETDPRYGPTGIGWPGEGDASVSKASLVLRQGRRQGPARPRLGQRAADRTRSAADRMSDWRDPSSPR